MKKISLSLFVFSIFVITFPEIGLSQRALDVGALIPFTGRWGDSGRECAKGMLDAGKWLNQRGGVYGRRLQISLIDDTSQAAETVAAFRKLNEADRVLLLYTSSTIESLPLSVLSLPIWPTLVNILISSRSPQLHLICQKLL